MRKYVQVLLVVLSVLSVVSLLIYRHEYNKLRYVLEVLNFFGSPGTSPANSSCAISVNLSSLLSPSPAWQRIGNAAFIYSAFWTDKSMVQAIALGLLSENLNYGCKLWYKDGTDVKGVFSFSGIARRKSNLKNLSSRNKGYIFNCEPADGNEVPVGVTFFKSSSEDSFGFVSVTKVNYHDPNWNKTAICVMPSDKNIGDIRRYSEFLSFHQVLDVKDYFVYGHGNTLNLLSSIHSKHNFNINTVPLIWNFPFNSDLELMRIVAESDCLLRTRGLYHNVVVLNWHQFVVPRYHGNISRLIRDFDPEDKVSRLQLQQMVFCTDYEDGSSGKSTLPMIFRKNKYTTLKTDVGVLVHRPSVSGRKVQKISKEIASVHLYIDCKNVEVQGDLKIDDSMQRFYADLKLPDILKTQDML